MSMASGYIARHVLSQPVYPPAAAILSTAKGSMEGAGTTFVYTDGPHYFVTGDTVRIAGATLPEVNGDWVSTRVTPTSFTVPTKTTGPGAAGGSVVRLKVREPLTLDEGKLRAGLDWVAGDERDALMEAFIAAARQKVELDAGVSLLSQVRDVFYDALADPSVILLPPGARPLDEVLSFNFINSAGTEQTVPPADYIVDHYGARISLVAGKSWPSDLRTFQPYRVRIVSGWPDPIAIPPLLMHAVGLLTAHYATAGRDLATVGTIVSTTPYGYDEAIAPFIQVVLA